MTLMINDIADVINISVSNPAESEYDIFVGLEHYDVGEPIITRYGSTKMLTTACKKFSAGDILLARRNVYLRRAGLVKFDGLTSGDSIVIRIKPNLSIEGVNSQEISRLLPFVLNTNAFWDFANTNSDGTMSKRLSPQMLLSYEFNLPPFSNQKPLADKLWAAYNLKASKLKLIDAIDEMVKSQFIEMFGSKSSGDKWPIKYLSEIVDPNCPISYGIVQPGDELEDGVPIVRPVDLNSNYYVYKNGLKRTTEAISNSYKRTILRGDELLLCVRGTTGVMGLATEELKGGNVTRGITPLYFKEGFNRIYLLGAFLSDDVQAYIKDNTVGSTLKGINMERVRKIQIPIPPIEIQNKWEEVFKQADKSKFELKKSIEAIDKVIKSLINNI